MSRCAFGEMPRGWSMLVCCNVPCPTCSATRHARSGSCVELHIRRRSPEAVEITVENEGEAIDAAHLPQLFDRFFRVDPARTHADRNHGLGLAIVGSIA